MIALPAVWVYKNNYKAGKGGDWDEFFEDFTTRPWGGTRVTNKKSGKRMVLEEMAPGDIVICWQSERRVVAGLASVSEVRITADGEADLILTAEVQYEPQIKLLADKANDPALAAVGAFKQGNAATFYRTSPDEAKVLLARVGLYTEAEMA